MDMDRRSFLATGLAYVGMTVARTNYLTDLMPAHDLAADQRMHPFTRSLLERAIRAGNAVDQSRVERVIHDRADSLGCFGRPVIKWMPDPQAAFDHLCRYGLVPRQHP